MTDTPSYPLILSDKSGYLDLIDDKESLAQTNVLGFVKGAYLGFTAYDDNGDTWIVNELKTTYPINGLTKLLAHTIYNPFINVTFKWKKEKSYKLNDLKRIIARQVDKGDDVLTQYEDGEVIKKEIERCESFPDMIFVRNKFIFKVNKS